MRALCGAIISAGAMIGLGLLAIGIGNRYHGYPTHDTVPLKELDTALALSLVILLITVVIGLTVAFLGLAYHHHRRHFEMHGRTPAERSSSHQITV
jgi:hypothetical protein